MACYLLTKLPWQRDKIIANYIQLGLIQMQNGISSFVASASTYAFGGRPNFLI